MKNLILAICCIGLLSGCASGPKCTDVAVYDYGDNNCLQGVHWFQADYYDRPVVGYDGIVIATKYLGQGSYDSIAHCKDSVLLDGWYAVNINDAPGSWVLTGEGWGRHLVVRNFAIKAQDIKRISKGL
jgi:hypothetical protein